MKPFKCINAQPRKDRLPLNRFATFATAGTSHRLDRAWEDVHSRPWSTRKSGVFDQKHNKFHLGEVVYLKKVIVWVS